MAYVPAKIIERELKKENINVDGYTIIENIDYDSHAEAKELGMDKGITEEFEFSSEYPMEDITLIFYGEMIKAYREIAPDQEIPYYYPKLNSCKIKKDGVEKNIPMDVHWGKY